MSGRRALSRLAFGIHCAVVPAACLLAFVGFSTLAQAQCSYAVGSSPTLTGSISGPDEVEPGAQPTFSATAADNDDYTEGEAAPTSVADTTTIIWTASDGSPTGPTRGDTFTWTAPTLGANENERNVTITAQADDIRQSNPCPSGCGGCSGNRNDAPGQSAQKTFKIVRAKSCDNDGNGTTDDWKQCDTDGDGTKDGCYVCDKNSDGIKDDCYQCDTNGDGTKDACYVCDTNDDGVYDACYSHDTNGDGTNDSCCPTYQLQLAFDDDFSTRSKTMAGVGETGHLTAVQATGQTMGTPTYSTSDANCISINSSTGAWTAKDHKCTCRLCATVNGCKQCKTVNVVEPTGAYQEKCGATVTFPGQAGVGMRNVTYLLPQDVSFTNITVHEGTCPAVGTLSLAFVNGNAAYDHAAWGAAGVSDLDSAKGCMVEGPNGANANCALPYDYIENHTDLHVGAGTFKWNIPWQFSIGTVADKEFTRLLHNAAFDGSRGCTLSKGGVFVSHTEPEP